MIKNNVMSPSVQFYARDEWDKMAHYDVDGCVYVLPKGTVCGNQNDLVMVVNGGAVCYDHTVSVRVSGNGSVSCNYADGFRNRTNVYSVMKGDNIAIVITPDEKSRVKSLFINGVDATGEMPNFFEIKGVSEDFSVIVEFEEVVTTTYSLDVTAFGNGVVSYNGVSVKGTSQSFTVTEGSDITLKFVPDPENALGTVIVNNVDVSLMVEDGVYEIKNVTQNINVGAKFNISPSGFPVPKYVDMGCGVYWADWDVGATDSSKYGLYYGWGALTDADGDYAKGFGGESIAGTEYDVANAKWGNGWRMPTYADFEELFSKCRAPERVKNGDISGYRLTSKYTNNSIFLPAAGYASKDKYAEVGRYLYFWTAVKDPNGTNPVLCRFTASGPVSRPNSPRLRAMVRAVYSKSEAEPETDPEAEGAGKAVDLGLSVKWSDINLGAKEDTDAGCYIAWGDVKEPDNFDYSKSAHTFYKDGKYENIGKDFNTGNNYRYDAARQMWKGTWRVPTQSEMSELWTNCTWEWMNKEGVNGYKVTGPSGKSIFLPARGWKSGPNDKDQLKQHNRFCGYWTSSLNLRNTDYGLNLQANEETNNPIPGTYREFGLNIRPVCE